MKNNIKLELLGGTAVVFLTTASILQFASNLKLVPTLLISSYASSMMIPYILGEKAKEDRKLVEDSLKLKKLTK